MFTKEKIIKQLQKYTKENSGKTPSEKDFYKNTEITRYDRMKHWSNYGELARESGLTPNRFDNTKYSHDQLCEIFIKVIREKDKWPTRGVLDVKHHRDSFFPDSSTFYNKLGLKRILANSILEFTEDKTGYDDVIKICNHIIKSTEDESSEETGMTSGVVYLGKQQGYYKIGKTKDVDRRREDITLLGPESFKLIHEIKTDDMSGVEKYWHNRFESKRKRGEWFNLSKTDIKDFKRWKKIY